MKIILTCYGFITTTQNNFLDLLEKKLTHYCGKGNDTPNLEDIIIVRVNSTAKVCNGNKTLLIQMFGDCKYSRPIHEAITEAGKEKSFTPEFQCVNVS